MEFVYGQALFLGYLNTIPHKFISYISSILIVPWVNLNVLVVHYQGSQQPHCYLPPSLDCSSAKSVWKNVYQVCSNSECVL